MPTRNRNGKDKKEALARLGDRELTAIDEFIRYRAARAGIEGEIAENERWWRNKNAAANGAGFASDGPDSPNCGDIFASCDPASGGSHASGGSAWLFNCVAGKHADAMDSIPTPTVLPREESDGQSASELSEILPALLTRNGFEDIWSDCWYDKLKNGTAVYGVFWDSSLQNGLGDVLIKRVDVTNLFWEPGVSDIQDSMNVFYAASYSDETLLRNYPQLKEILSRGAGAQGNNIYFADDGHGRHTVIDRYYKKISGGRTLLHLCRSVCGVVVFASERDPLYSERGYYDHGLYPFVIDKLYPKRNSPDGFGLIEVLKNSKNQIDQLESAVVLNSRMAAARRYFAKDGSGINEEEFTDLSSPIVHYSGSGDPSDAVMPIEVPKLDPACLDLLEYKIRELKETSGNRDFNQGSTSSGVTAASAIEALQEAGNKLSRDMLKGSYNAFEKVCTMVIELIRQFYTLPRCFRITGKNGTYFRTYDNSRIVPQKQGVYEDRLPVFDITVRAEKQSPYTKAAINELARELFNEGLFAPDRRHEALICLEMMDFEGRDAVIRLVEKGAAANAE